MTGRRCKAKARVRTTERERTVVIPHPSNPRSLMVQRNLRALLLLCAIGVVWPGQARANWVASGTFRYQDREFDQSGYTGDLPQLPVRFASVEIRDLNVNGGQQLLATGATDG